MLTVCLGDILIIASLILLDPLSPAGYGQYEFVFPLIFNPKI
jgi:hypothetical protein